MQQLIAESAYGPNLGLRSSRHGLVLASRL
jgi:hypothetical protein